MTGCFLTKFYSAIHISNFACNVDLKIFLCATEVVEL